MKSSLRKKFSSFSLLILFFLTGCAGNTNNSNGIVSDSNVKSATDSTHFAIVLIKGAKTGDAIKSKIEDLKLDTEPVLTDKDLISYKWKEHELELRQDFDINKSLGKVPVDGLPFIVIADNKRVYLGAFWTPISSASSSIPVIMVPQNPIKIDAGYPSKIINSQLDPRSNQLIYNALKYVGKIKE